MTGNPAIDKIILGINGIITLSAAALVVYSHTMISPPPTNTDKEFKNMIQSSILELQKDPIAFKEMVINLYSREARLRFLNVIMNIEVFDENQRMLIEERRPIILDFLIDIASNMQPNELNSVTGRILLESRVKNKFNYYMKRPVIKKIYFSKFIVQ